MNSSSSPKAEFATKLAVGRVLQHIQDMQGNLQHDKNLIDQDTHTHTQITCYLYYISTLTRMQSSHDFSPQESHARGCAVQCLSHVAQCGSVAHDVHVCPRTNTGHKTHSCAWRRLPDVVVVEAISVDATACSRQSEHTDSWQMPVVCVCRCLL